MTYLTDVSNRMKKKQQALNNKQKSLQNQMSTTNEERSSKRQKYIQSAITAKVNTTGNARSGKSYFEEYDSKKGGYWHVYDNGRRVFVPKHKTGIAALPKKGQKGGTYKYLNRSQSA